MNELTASIDDALARAMSVRPTVGGSPYLAEGLRLAGVRTYLFDVPSSSVVFATERGDLYRPGAARVPATRWFPHLSRRARGDIRRELACGDPAAPGMTDRGRGHADSRCPTGIPVGHLLRGG